MLRNYEELKRGLLSRRSREMMPLLIGLAKYTKAIEREQWIQFQEEAGLRRRRCKVCKNWFFPYEKHKDEVTK